MCICAFDVVFKRLRFRHFLIEKCTAAKYLLWWFVESYLIGCFCLFTPKLWEGGADLQIIVCQSVSVVEVVSFWEGGADLQMIVCQSVSVVEVVSTLIGGRDTQTFTAI